VNIFGAADSLAVEKHDNLSGNSLKDSTYIFDEIVITDCNFEEVGSHIINGMPPYKNMIITNNKIQNSFTYLSIFVTIQTGETNNIVSSRFSNNIFNDLREYDNRSVSGGIASDNLFIIRTYGNSIIEDNIFNRVGSSVLYISSGGNIVQNNQINYLSDFFVGNRAFLLMNKIRDHSEKSVKGNVYNGNTIKILQGNPVLFRTQSDQGVLLKNENWYGTTSGQRITANYPEDLRYFTKDKAYQVSDSAVWVSNTRGYISNEVLTSLSNIESTTSNLTDAVVVFYNYFTQQWEVRSSVQPITLLQSENYTKNCSFKAQNCQLTVDQIFQPNNLDFPAYEVLFENCNISIMQSMGGNLGFDQPKRWIVRNTHFNWFSRSQSWDITEEITFDNVTITKSAGAILELVAPHVSISNLTIRDNDYLLAQDFSTASAHTQIAAISFEGSKKLIVDGLKILDTDIGGVGNIYVIGFDTVSIKNLYSMPINEKSRQYGGRGLWFTEENRDYVTLSDIKINIEDETGSDKSVLVDFHPSSTPVPYTIKRLYLDNIKAVGPFSDELDTVIEADSLTVSERLFVQDIPGYDPSSFLSAPVNSANNLYNSVDTIQFQNTTLRDTTAATNTTTIKVGEWHNADTRVNTVTFTVPPGLNIGDTFTVSDAYGNAATNNITIDALTNGYKHFGVSENIIMDINRAIMTCNYHGPDIGLQCKTE
jgi:hypothetical protein